MTKVLYIIGLVCCIGMFFTFVYLMEEDQQARWSSYDYYDYGYDSYDSYGDYSYGGYGYDTYDAREEIAFLGGVLGLLFCAFFIVTYIIGMIKVKRTVAKVFNIIGVSIAGLFFFINMIPIMDPGGVDFDEFGFSWIFLLMFMIPCCIIGLVQSVKYDKELKYGFDKAPKARYGEYQPSYNPNHPSASGGPLPGVPAPPGQGHPQQQPQPPQQPTQPQQQPPSQPQPLRPQQPVPPPPPQPEAPGDQGGVKPPPPAPTVAPPPPIQPIDNDPIITDEDGDDEIKSIDDL